MALNYRTPDDGISMMLTEFDLDNIRNILSQPVRYDWFSAVMLRACQKADAINLRKIAANFPDIAAAFLIFHTGTIPEAFRRSIPNWEFYIRMMTPRIANKENDNG
jgi:hypothetical protein